MKFTFRFGKRFGFDRLTDEQKSIVERLERGELSEEEATRLLGVDVRVGEWRIGASSGGRAPEPGSDQPPADPEDAKAREMIERISREVDAETGG